MAAKMKNMDWNGDPVMKPYPLSGRILPAPVQRIFEAMAFNDAAAVIGSYELQIYGRQFGHRALLYRTPEGVRVNIIGGPINDAQFLMDHYGIDGWALVDIKHTIEHPYVVASSA